MDYGGQANIQQPGGRKPAPDSLGLVQAFINSNYDLDEHNHGAELLGSPRALQEWFAARGLAGSNEGVSERDLRRALSMRESLRDLLIAKHEGRQARLEAEFSVRAELKTNGATVTTSGTSVRSALDLILALAMAAMLDGTWHRLKACRECSWAFYDHSRNQAGSWCSMKVCGGRVKQRKHYRRTRPATANRQS
jgi:predicted RNA-binding Zn ribbon-like protein